MTTLWEKFLSLLFPRKPECLICGVDTSSGELLLCPRCKSFLYSEKPLLCSLCGKPQEGFFSHCCKLHPLSGALSLGHYEGGLKNLIHAYKYQGLKEVSNLLGDLLLITLKKVSLPSLDFIIPVPLHPRRERKRGFNQSLLLAKKLSQGLEVPLHQGLIRIKDTQHQTFLDKAHREVNLKDAFKVREKRELMGKRLLLIDDVFTTGATAKSCAYTLIEAGVQEVFVLTVARG